VTATPLCSAEAFEVAGVGVEFACEFAEFGGGGAVVYCCDDVFGRAAELEEAVLEVGQFGGGEDYGVFGEAAALDGGAAFVGALAAGLGAVAAGSAGSGFVG
jgi:hypothetical protein